MGGRRSKSVSVLLGKGRSYKKAKKQIGKSLDERSATVVAKTIIRYAAQSDPAVAVLYNAYKLAKFTYPIVKKGIKEYEKTGDSEKAVNKMAGETVKQVKKEIKHKTIDVVADASWSEVKKSANIETSGDVDKLVPIAASETIKEALQ